MSELVPCPACMRHVTMHEIACPFCARALPAPRAQRAYVIGRVTRAAVFSAALAACSSDKPKQEPPPAKGSDDLEKLLDEKPEKVEHPDVVPPADAAEALAQTVDAAVTSDAGVDVEAQKKKLAERKKLAEQKKREAERREAERLRAQEELLRNDQIHNAKPYGAPPARRRIV